MSAKLRACIIYIAWVLLLNGLILLCFNPGYMNIDTMDLWSQAHLHVYRDWHPVLIRVLWALLRHVYHGPQSMLIFEDLLFCVGAVLILQKQGRPWLTCLLLTAVVLFPPVFAYLGTIGKDSLFAVSMIFMIGSYYLYRRYRTRSALSLCLAGGFLAFSVRQPGVFGVAPILGLLFWEALREHRHALLHVTCRVALALVVFFGANSLIKTAVHATTTYPYQGIPLYDLAALSVRTNELLVPPAFLSPSGTLPNIVRSTNTRFINTLIWPWAADNPLKFSYNSGDVHQLFRVWLKAIVHHPVLYLRWRGQVLATLAGFDKKVTTAYDAIIVAPNVWNARFHRTPAALAELSFLEYTRNSLFFRAYLYLFVLTSTFAYAVLKKWHDLMVVSASGLMYFSAYFFISINSEFRFVCYPVFLSVVIAVRCLTQLLRDIPAVWDRWKNEVERSPISVPLTSQLRIRRSHFARLHDPVPSKS